MAFPISIVLSTYNRQTLLPRMLDSLLGQTFPDFELILINNGSTDQTDAVCRRYAQQDVRIRYFLLEQNQGIAKARNFGLNLVSGDYISMVDDDDYCCPDMMKTLYHMAITHQADIAVVGCQNAYGEELEDFYVYDGEYVLYGSDGLSAFLERKLYNTNPGTKLFRRTLFDDQRWIEGTRVDDIHFIYRLFARAQTVVTCGKPLYIKRKHDGNVTSFLSGNRLTPDVLDDYLAMQDERVDYITQNVPALARQVRYARVSYMISMVERIEKGDAIGCETQLEFMKEFLRLHADDLLGTHWTSEREKRLMQTYIYKNEVLS